MDLSCTFNQNNDFLRRETFHACGGGTFQCDMLNWRSPEARFLRDKSGLLIVEIPCIFNGPKSVEVNCLSRAPEIAEAPCLSRGPEIVSMVLIRPEAGEMDILKSGIAETRLLELLARLEQCEPGIIELLVPALYGCAEGLLINGAVGLLPIASVVHNVCIHRSVTFKAPEFAFATSCLFEVRLPMIPRFDFDRPFATLFVDRQKSAVLLAAAVVRENLLKL